MGWTDDPRTAFNAAEQAAGVRYRGLNDADGDGISDYIDRDAGSGTGLVDRDNDGISDYIDRDAGRPNKYAKTQAKAAERAAKRAAVLEADARRKEAAEAKRKADAAWAMVRLERQKAEAAERAQRRQELAAARAARQSVYDAVGGIFASAGLDPKEVAAAIRGSMKDGPPSVQNAIEAVRSTQSWQKEYGQDWSAWEKNADKFGGSMPDEGAIRARRDEFKEAVQDYVPKKYLKRLSEPGALARFINNDMSPEELGRRAQAADSFIDTADRGTRDALKRYFGIGRKDLNAWSLDPKGWDLEKMQVKFAASDLLDVANGDKGRKDDVRLSVKDSMQLAKDDSFSTEQKVAAIRETRSNREELTRLAALGGEGAMGDKKLIRTFLGDDPKGEDKIKRLKSKERSKFDGQGGGASGAFGTSSGGSY